MSAFKSINAWYRAAREKDRVKNPLRIRVLMKELWPWYLPSWTFPAVFMSACFMGQMPREKLVARGLVPAVICYLVLFVPTRKKDLSWRETIFFYKFIPLCSLLASAMVWAIIHDKYMK